MDFAWARDGGLIGIPYNVVSSMTNHYTLDFIIEEQILAYPIPVDPLIEYSWIITPCSDIDLQAL
jgi:hypothetical protein